MGGSGCLDGSFSTSNYKTLPPFPGQRSRALSFAALGAGSVMDLNELAPGKILPQTCGIAEDCGAIDLRIFERNLAIRCFRLLAEHGAKSSDRSP